jgi:signal transduction histidine kinase
MELEGSELVQVLLWGLIGFAVVNLLINLTLLFILKTRDNLRLLVAYWALVVATVLVQTKWDQSELLIVLAFSASVLPVLVMNVLAYQLIDRKSPWMRFLIAWPLVLGLIVLLDQQGAAFTTVALPASLLNAVPLFGAGYAILVTENRRTTPLQKLFGVLMLIQGVHFINFAFLRMVPGTQLGGWMGAYVLYDILGTVLPSIALEKSGLDEKINLERLVKSRTEALDVSLEKNRNLLKILLHDITNPISAMGLYLTAMGEQAQPSPTLMERLKTAHGAVKNIVGNVSSIYTEKMPDSCMTAACLEDSYQEMSVIFEQSLQRKRVSLNHHFELSPTLLFRMDKTLFTHSILGNLVNNALKFSLPDSVITITAREQGGRLILRVEDGGIGIPPDLLRQLEAEKPVIISRPGTTGDQGMGLGLSSVRSVVATYGGSMTISSRDSANHPQHHGTCVTVVFDTLSALTRSGSTVTAEKA